MDIWTVLKACARRWYVFVPVLALTMGLAYVQMQAAPPAYLATSTATLTGPALVPGDEPGEVIEVNPFETLGGSLTQTTKVLVALMDSTPKRDAFVDEGVTASYEVAQDESVVYFDVSGTDPDEVVASATRLVELLDVETANLQGRAVEAPESRIRAVAVSVPVTAQEDPVAGIRVFAVIAALGLVASIAAALATDAVLQSRRRRAASAATGEADDVEHADRTHAGTRPAPSRATPSHAAHTTRRAPTTATTEPGTSAGTSAGTAPDVVPDTVPDALPDGDGALRPVGRPGHGADA